MKRWLLVLMALMLGIATAQSLSGTWTLKLQNGGVLTLVIQESGGQVQGTLTGNGVTLQLEGELNGSDAEGIITNQNEQAVFRLAVQGNNLTLIVTDLDPNTGQADQSTAQTFEFIRQNAATSSNPTPPITTLKPNPNLPDPLIGRFNSKEMSLEIAGANGKYKGTIMLSNQKYAMTGQGSNGVLRGSFSAKGSTYLFEARVNQNAMTVLLNGKTYKLSRQVAANPTTTNPSTKPPISTSSSSLPALPESSTAKMQEQAQYKAGTRVSSSQFGVSFVVPQGFKGATTQGVTVLGNGRTDTNGVNILIFPFLGANLDDMNALMSKPIDYGKIKFNPIEILSTANRVTVRYSSDQYTAVGVAALGKGNGLGVQVIGYASNPNLEQLAKSLVNSLKFSSASLNSTFATIQRGLSGKYLFAYSYSGTTSNTGSFSSESKRQWDLCSNGRYFFEGNSESAFNVQLPNGGDTQGNAGGASQNQDGSSGRWKVVVVANSVALILFKDDQTVEINLLSNLDRKIPFLNGKELGSFGASNKCR